MSYRSVPAYVSVTFITNATINTATSNRVVIAAPGANFALRIVHMSVAPQQTNTGRILVIVSSTGAIVSLWRAGFNDTGITNTPPEPGIQLPVNAALLLSDLSNVASQTYGINVYYFVDSTN